MAVGFHAILAFCEPDGCNTYRAAPDPVDPPMWFAFVPPPAIVGAYSVGEAAMGIRRIAISVAFAAGLAAVPFAAATAQYYPPPPCSPFPLFWPVCVAGAVVGTAAAIVTAPFRVFAPPPYYYGPPPPLPPYNYYGPRYYPPPYNYYGPR
jgi:hypothetical protein